MNNSTALISTGRIAIEKRGECLNCEWASQTPAWADLPVCWETYARRVAHEVQEHLQATHHKVRLVYTSWEDVELRD